MRGGAGGQREREREKVERESARVEGVREGEKARRGRER